MDEAKRNRVELFLISVGGLYLELVLIRWLASDIRVFAHFKNFPLMAAFIGLGLGCYVADRRPIRISMAAILLFGISLAATFSDQLHLASLFFPDPALYLMKGSILSPDLLNQAREYPVFNSLVGRVPDAPLLALIGVTSFTIISFLFVATAQVFYPIGQITGALFGRLQPLTAYSVNVAGALLGSLFFSLVSHFEFGPLVWLLPPLAMLVYFVWRLCRRTELVITIAAASAVVVLLALSGPEPGERLVWSPYYRINVIPGVYGGGSMKKPIPEAQGVGLTLRVNHEYFQRAVDLSPQAVERAPVFESWARHYNLPYKLLGHVDRVLVVGAGMGNDASAALRAGAKSVVAVDIDPAILRLGRELHPEKPYADSRLQCIVDDARAYFRKHSQDQTPRFDLITFGLLDSQTALSSMSSVRLEFYVYTEESFKEALRLLDPEHGLAVITFCVGWRDWVGRRFYRTIEAAAGAPPLVLSSGGYDGGISYLTGPGLAKLDRARLAELGVKDVTATYATGSVSTCRDDWPFLYLNPNHWPWVYMVALGLLMGAGSILVRRAMKHALTTDHNASYVLRFDTHMFLMGAAFMLVETSAIARLSLLFGATWMVNAVVISAVLLMILGANLLVSTGKAPPLWTNFVLLGASLVIVYLVPFENFVAISGGWLWAGLLVALPVLFSGLVFAETFASTPSAPISLGCNMFGAILGGALEAISLTSGIRFLTLVALAIYAISAMVVARRRAGRIGILTRAA